MNDKIEYYVISPDGFDIGIDTFETKKLAYDAVVQWIQRYVKQGYYSSNNGKIILDDIIHYCKMITVKNDVKIDSYYL